MSGAFSGAIQTAGEYGALDHSAHRAIDDIVVPGSLGEYPLKMTRYYNSRAQHYALTAIGLSPGWAHEYSWLLWSGRTKVVSPHGSVYDPLVGSRLVFPRVGREAGPGGLQTVEESPSTGITA